MKGVAVLILLAFVALVVWQRWRLKRHSRDDIE
jgi:hypothetical protein